MYLAVVGGLLGYLGVLGGFPVRGGVSHPMFLIPPPQLGLGRWSNPQYVEFITVLEDSHRLGTPETKVWG